MDRPMHGFRVPLLCLLGSLTLSGCVHAGPAATAGNNLDTMAYGPGGPTASPATAYQPHPAWGGGALAALRNSFAAMPARAKPLPTAAPYIPARAAYSPMPARTHDSAYRLDAGDKLRIVVYGQDGLTNTYTVGANGAITMPLIGSVRARGLTPAELARNITDRLRTNYIREPYVAAEIETYRPFFILGEVAAPGQYPYVPNMTAESAVAIAGGYSPRARRDEVTVTHTTSAGPYKIVVPPTTPISPGDTIVVGERWF
jgi:polysaccharide export outer membrane protein